MRKTIKEPAENQLDTSDISVQVIRQIYKVTQKFVPGLYERLGLIPDHRIGVRYSMKEVLHAGICIFLFKRGSRNNMDLLAKNARFRKNYRRIFKMDLPSIDVVEDVLRILPENELESLKCALIKELFERRILEKYRLLEEYYCIALDGLHISTYTEDYCGECISKTVSKTPRGKEEKGNEKEACTAEESPRKLYFHYALEAKLVSPTGLSLSVCTEWIRNDGTDYQKQDCEATAFKRMAEKLKKQFPRLKICILADGLYPNKTFFDLCKANDWAFIVTFKDGNLPSVWQEVELLSHCALEKQCVQRENKNSTFSWINNIEYQGHNLHWIECIEDHPTANSEEGKTSRFVHLSNIASDSETVTVLSATGRLRWKIENEGFNTQKNGGYGLGHKFSRTSFLAFKNYYQCLQIAHLVNQLVERSTTIQDLLRADEKMTITFLWEGLIGFLRFGIVDEKELDHISLSRTQIRLE